MIKTNILVGLMLLNTITLYAQDSVLHRIIFIGNGGEISSDQQNVIKSAAEKVIRNKTVVIYLGENILLNGFVLTGGGIYFAPARVIVIRAEVGYSVEGVYPPVSLGFRY